MAQPGDKGVQMFCAKTYLLVGIELSSIVLSAKYLAPIWAHDSWGWLMYAKFLVWIVLNLAIAYSFSKLWPISGVGVLNVMIALGVYIGWVKWAMYGFLGAMAICLPLAFIVAMLKSYDSKTMYIAAIACNTLVCVFLFHEGMSLYGAIVVFLFALYMVYDVGLLVDGSHRSIHDGKLHRHDAMAASIEVWRGLIYSIVTALTFAKAMLF